MAEKKDDAKKADAVEPKKPDEKKDGGKTDDAKKAAPKADKPAGKPSGRRVIPPAPKKPTNTEPFSDKSVKDIDPVAKGEKCVVINPKPRCIVLPGVPPLKPGRNTRETAAVTAAMRNNAARRLGLVIEELGDPEKETQTQKVMNIANTFDADVLKQIIDDEQDPVVVSAAKAQLEKICPTKKKIEEDGEAAGEREPE